MVAGGLLELVLVLVLDSCCRRSRFLLLRLLLLRFLRCCLFLRLLGRRLMW